MRRRGSEDKLDAPLLTGGRSVSGERDTPSTSDRGQYAGVDGDADAAGGGGQTGEGRPTQGSKGFMVRWPAFSSRALHTCDACEMVSNICVCERECA
jgi:hypothetical protein